jgi:hypothetical protein
LKEDLAARTDTQRPAIVDVEISSAGRVTSVRIHRDWRRTLSPAALGEAVLDGYAFVAGRRMVQALATDLENEETSGGSAATDRSREPGAATDRERSSGATGSGTHLDELRHKLRENRAQLDRLRRLQNETPADDGERRVTSPLGCFTATLTRIGVVGIEGNTRAILDVPLHELQEDAVDLFERAGVGEELSGGKER